METAKAVIEIKSDGHAHVLAGIIAFKNDVRFIYIIEQHYETFIQFFLIYMVSFLAPIKCMLPKKDFCYPLVKHSTFFRLDFQSF